MRSPAPRARAASDAGSLNAPTISRRRQNMLSEAWKRVRLSRPASLKSPSANSHGSLQETRRHPFSQGIRDEIMAMLSPCTLGAEEPVPVCTADDLIDWHSAERV